MRAPSVVRARALACVAAQSRVRKRACVRGCVRGSEAFARCGRIATHHVNTDQAEDIIRQNRTVTAGSCPMPAAVAPAVECMNTFTAQNNVATKQQQVPQKQNMVFVCVQKRATPFRSCCDRRAAVSSLGATRAPLALALRADTPPPRLDGDEEGESAGSGATEDEEPPWEEAEEAAAARLARPSSAEEREDAAAAAAAGSIAPASEADEDAFNPLPRLLDTSVEERATMLAGSREATLLSNQLSDVFGGRFEAFSKSVQHTKTPTRKPSSRKAKDAA